MSKDQLRGLIDSVINFSKDVERSRPNDLNEDAARIEELNAFDAEAARLRKVAWEAYRTFEDRIVDLANHFRKRMEK